ncbi:hypothetical protein [Scytonema sp. HK-05]|nr:hypothetical protein [Scytonema sp. HK-05]
MALLFGIDGFDRMVRKLIDAFPWVFTQLDWGTHAVFHNLRARVNKGG